jgi:1-acyl-sn-glycerol-3-phosphate acyltransferase
MRARKKSLLVSLGNAADTLSISIGTLWESQRARGVQRDTSDLRLAWWSARVVARAKLQIEVTGREHIGASEAFVVMSNHQSHYDVPLLYHVLGTNMRMVAKQELGKVPLFGAALRASGFVLIDRKNRAQAIESMQSAHMQIQGGTSIFIAPEGTRSRDGALGDFKKGGFVLAQQVGARILPVTIQGTRDALPSGAFRSTTGARVRVHIHSPIAAPAGLEGKAQRDAWLAAVRNAIAAPLERR